ncbi:MAG: hypothetical protein E7048_02635 [Lentisphaerae bacterium]|nr:hypothetical protein [Lentisphaerota bacterium]
MKNLPHYTIIFLFFTLLLLPQAADDFFELRHNAELEKRNLTPFPQKFEYGKIASQLEECYNDRIPFRPVLIKACRKIQDILSLDSPGKVLPGKEGFLFLRNPKLDDPIEQFRGRRKSRQYNLRRCRNFLKELFAFLQSNNIQALIVIAPNKVQVYPEYLPEKRRYIPSAMMPDLQFARFMHKNAPEIPVLHLRQKMLREKKHFGNALYYRTDSHWGPVAGYIGAREIIKHLDSASCLPEPENLKTGCSGNPEPGDLISLSLRPLNITENYPEIKLLTPEYKGRSKKIGDNILYTHNPAAKDKRRVVMYRDSFGKALMPYLSWYFQEVYYIKSRRISRKEIKKIAPDICIIQYVARAVGYMDMTLHP